MAVAQQASAEIDRLVIGVNRRVGPKHGDRLRAMGHDIGLGSLDLLPTFAGFLLDGLLTRDLALTRMMYAEPERILGRLDELEEKGQIRVDEGRLRAADTLRPLLKAMESAVADVAFDTWKGEEVAVSIATEAARSMRAAITPEHAVAAVHANVKEPIDRYKLLVQRLETLRYIRQHEHAAAWAAHDLGARQIVAMTKIWRDGAIEGDGAVVDELRDDGYVKKSDPPKLTSKGRKIREAIEDETNARSQKSFDVLEPDVQIRFRDALARLPD